MEDLSELFGGFVSYGFLNFGSLVGCSVECGILCRSYWIWALLFVLVVTEEVLGGSRKIWIMVRSKFSSHQS